MCSSNNASNVEASSGENESATVPILGVTILADICDAILTLPNGTNPDGCTAFFNSFKYVDSDSPIATS
jgi:hypothetical protein